MHQDPTGRRSLPTVRYCSLRPGLNPVDDLRRLDRLSVPRRHFDVTMRPGGGSHLMFFFFSPRFCRCDAIQMKAISISLPSNSTGVILMTFRDI